VPRVYWSVHALEGAPRGSGGTFDGGQLADLELDQWSLDQRRKLAYLIAETWMTISFRQGFFHADPHPANISWLSPERIGSWTSVSRQAHRRTTCRSDDAALIDAASENIEALPKRLSDLGCRYRSSQKISSSPSCASCTTATYGASIQRDRSDPGDP